MAQVDPVVGDIPIGADEPESRPGGIPLYVWVILAAVLAVPVGLFVPREPTLTWGGISSGPIPIGAFLDTMPKVVLRLLTALATPLIVLAVLSALITNDIRGRQGLRMMIYYGINTIVAITIGLALCNWVRPGVGVDLSRIQSKETAPKAMSIGEVLLDLIPQSIGESFVRNHLAQLVLVTLALGIGLSRIRDEQQARGETSYQTVVDLVTVGFELLMRVLLWVVALIPIAVFGVVASGIMKAGLEVFQALGWFMVAVLVGLACQISWYLMQILVFGRMTPGRFLKGAGPVMATSMSTASTGATMPVTLRALQGPLGVSRESSQLAACVGTNFNNDGTALYQAAVVLFLAQTLGRNLSLSEQIIIALTTVVASIGAGCIPSGGFVTLPLILAAVGIPADRLPIILVVDWFLDRCRTSSNILGDMTVAVLLDRTATKTPEPAVAPALDG